MSGLLAACCPPPQWRNPGFLSLIAAGNDGSNSNHTTVGSPATAKSVLSIGAGNNFPKGTSSGSNYNFLFRYTRAGTMRATAVGMSEV